MKNWPRGINKAGRQACLARAVSLSSQNLNGFRLDLHSAVPACSWDYFLIIPACALKSKSFLFYGGETRRGLLWGENESVPMMHLQNTAWHIASIRQIQLFQQRQRNNHSLLQWGKLWWLWAFIFYYGVWKTAEATWGPQASCLASWWLSFFNGQRNKYSNIRIDRVKWKDAFNKVQWLFLFLSF